MSRTHDDGSETDTDGTGTGCDCCGTAADSTYSERTNRWLDGDAPMEATLPADLQRALGGLLDDDPARTLEGWVGAVRDRLPGRTIAVDDLCHADEETSHRGVRDGETFHFQCFYDAVVLAALSDDDVAVHTESPAGTPIEAHATGEDDLTVDPPEAVFSFGVDERVEPPADGEPTHGDVYGAVCPYVKAFPDRGAYETWAEVVPASTVAMPLSGATELAAALVA